MSHYIRSVDDAVAVILGSLDDQVYDTLDEDDFEKLTEALEMCGKHFVFIDRIHSLSLTQDEFSKHALQIVSFISPKQYLCIYVEEYGGLSTETAYSNEEVLEKVHTFINKVETLSFEQVDTINEIISAYK